MTFAELLMNTPYTPPQGRPRTVRNLNMAATPNEIEEREIAIIKALHPIQLMRADQVAEKMKLSCGVITQALRVMARRGDIEMKSVKPEHSRSEVHYRRMK
jgi:predicted transcriptional regulator